MKTKPDSSTESSHSPEKRVFGLSGSPRKGGNSDVLLKHILKGVNENKVPAEAVRLCNYDYQPCIGCEKCRKDNMCTGLNDGMHLLYPKVIESQGIVLVCPTHNYNVTAWMKAFIDRLYCFYNFQNTRPRAWSSQLANQERKAVIIAICEQEDKKDMGFTLEAMRIPIEALGYQVIGEQAIFKTFDKGKVKQDSKALEKAFSLGKNLVKAIM